MKVTLVIEGTMETGRGPLFRRLGMLPQLAVRHTLLAVCLVEPDPEVSRALRCAGVPYTVRACKFSGWSITNLEQVGSAIAADAAAHDANLVVLDWEIWDLMRDLSERLPGRGIRFATVVHAVPFLNCPAEPGADFFADVERRLEAEPDSSIRAYIRDNAAQTLEVLPRLEILAPNRCVTAYLDHYFPHLPVTELDPGYAINLDEIHAAVRSDGGGPVDFVYMARLVEEKGLMSLPPIMAEIIRHPGFEEARLLLIGSFNDASVERRFRGKADRCGVAKHLEFAGWLSGADKYRQLARARAFIYPAEETDTFCICMLEALACGVPVACADVPFSRSIYRDVTAVCACPPGDAAAFAAAAVHLAQDPDLPAVAVAFAGHFGSWAAVAAAEGDAYAVQRPGHASR